jgi:hypothetical protein
MSDDALSTLIAHLLALGPVDEITDPVLRERARAAREIGNFATAHRCVRRLREISQQQIEKTACDLVIALLEAQVREIERRLLSD